MKKPTNHFICIFFWVLFKTILYAQAPDTLWTKTFGGNEDDRGFSVQQTTDGGYIITGYTESFGAGGWDVWLLKTNANGDTLWTKTYGRSGGSDTDWGRSVQQTTDGGYVITGNTNSTGAGNTDVWLIKTDANGDTLWTKTFGTISDDGSASVQQTTDSGYIITGNIEFFDALWLIKTDANGDTLWTKTFGGNGLEWGESVQQTSDGGYIIAGTTWSFGAGNTDVWLIKTDSNGDTLWTKTFGKAGLDYGYSVQQTSDEGYIVAGSIGDALPWLIKTDANGDTLWTKILQQEEGFAFSVQQTTDGGYIVPVSTGWLIKTDANGNILWTKSFGEDGLASSIQTTDGGYIITGYTDPPGPDFPDVWLIKVAPEITSLDESPYVSISDYQLQQNYPNPFNPETVITYRISGNVKTSLRIYDITGREVKTLVNQSQPAGEYLVTFNASGLASGIYIYRLRAGNFEQSRKMLLLR